MSAANYSSTPAIIIPLECYKGRLKRHPQTTHLFHQLPILPVYNSAATMLIQSKQTKVLKNNYIVCSFSLTYSIMRCPCESLMEMLDKNQVRDKHKLHGNWQCYFGKRPWLWVCTSGLVPRKPYQWLCRRAFVQQSPRPDMSTSYRISYC